MLQTCTCQIQLKELISKKVLKFGVFYNIRITQRNIMIFVIQRLCITKQNI